MFALTPICMIDDDAALYGGLEVVPQLPSVVELRNRLASVTSERKALESQLSDLQSMDQAARETIKDLTRRACILLATARRQEAIVIII